MPNGEAGKGLKEVFWGTLFGFVVLTFCIMAVEADLHSTHSKQQATHSDNDQHISELSSRLTLLESQSKVKDSTSNNKQNESSNFFSKILDFHITDALLVLFTALLAIKTSGLHKETSELRKLADTQRQDMLRSILATEKSANAAKESVEAIPTLQRAYVYVDDITISIVPPVWRTEKGIRSALIRKSKIQLSFINYGRTPANMVTVMVFAEFLDHTPDDEDTKRLMGGSDTSETVIVAIIGPDKTWETPSIGTANALDFENILLFQNHKLFIYCWGVIEYKDIFGKIHPTHFCRRLRIVGDAKCVAEPVGGFDRNRSD